MTILKSIWINRLSKYYKEIVGTTDRKAIARSFGWLFFDKIIRLGLGLIVGIWVTRYLGPYNYGFLNYTVAFSGLFVAFATMGLDSIVVKELMISPENTHTILGTTLVIRIFGSLLTVLFSVSAFTYLNSGNILGTEIVILSSITYVFQSVDVIDLYFQSKVNSKLTVIAKNISFLAFSVVRILLIQGKYTLIAFVWCTFCEVLLGEIILIYIGYKQSINIFQWKIEKNLGKTMLKKGWPLMLTSIMVLIYMKIDQVMLGQMVGKKIVGIYSAAVRVSELFYFIPLALATSLYPKQVNTKKESQQKYIQGFRQFFFYLSFISISISIVTAFTSRFIINLLFGSAFAEAAPILSINIWAGVFVSLGIGSNQFLVIDNLYSLSFYRTFAGAVSNVILNLILIPRYQAYGAAIATLISYAMSGFIMNIFDKRTREIFIIQLRSLFFADQLKGMLSGKGK